MTKGRSLIGRCLLAFVWCATLAHALEESQSPYLRLYADHPIEWRAWTHETLAAAREKSKPIFLSIGYLTCRGCRVMNEQTFLQPAVYEFLNEHFINILVDREERPDIDHVYQAFVAGTTGRGGWPLNVWLTPDLEPFLGGTFFPPEDRPGQRGFLSVSRLAARGWAEDRANVVARAAELTEALHQLATQQPTEGLGAGPAVWQAALEQLVAEADPDHGGFGEGPKFPHALNIRFLFRLSAEPRIGKHQRQMARELALSALAAVLDGGLHDREAGGFHRYTVDRAWSEPHYEKMLYDQAWITQSLLDAWQLSGEQRWADAACATIDFVRRDLARPDGALAASFNAHTVGDGPVLDDKVVTAWNGYMIAALVRAACLFNELEYFDTAQTAARRIRAQAYNEKSQRLYRLPGGPPGFAADYGAMIKASLALYEAGLDPVWLDWARDLQAAMERRFGDETAGGYFITEAEHSQVLVRMKDTFDDAEPAASSTAAGNLLRLAALTGEHAYRERAGAIWDAFAGHHRLRPAAMPLLLAQTMALANPAQQIIIAGDPEQDDTQVLWQVVRETYLPDAVILMADTGRGDRGTWPDYLQAMTPIDGQATAYVCEDFVCHLPVTTAAELRAQLTSE